jgi:hypothetical protein
MTIRRKFGFEMEVPLLITKKNSSGVLADPKTTTDVELRELNDPGTSELHVDHMAEPSTKAQLTTRRSAARHQIGRSACLRPLTSRASFTRCRIRKK